MEFSMDVSEKEFYQILAEEADKYFDPMDLVFDGEVPDFDKYDKYLPDQLVQKGFATGVLDIQTMRQCVHQMVEQGLNQ